MPTPPMPDPEQLSRSSGSERKAGVRSMFNRIAARYDLLNHVLSGGMDILWRRKAVRSLNLKPGGIFLDLATGTGDYAFTMLKREPGCRVIALDLAEVMLQEMDKKVRARKLASATLLVQGDAEQLPLRDLCVDGLTIGYGIRNFPDKRRALLECGRVVKPGGRIAILELAGLPNPILNRLFNLYFRLVLPLIGRLISGDSMAYSYLPASVARFPERRVFLDWMREAGFADARAVELSLGISTLFLAEKS